MTFTHSIERIASFGSMKCSYGTFTNAGGSDNTGGDIDTGLASCVFIKLQPTGNAAIATGAVTPATLPLIGSAVTIVTAAGEDGLWFALGY